VNLLFLISGRTGRRRRRLAAAALCCVRSVGLTALGLKDNAKLMLAASFFNVGAMLNAEAPATAVRERCGREEGGG
jgi:hypothetical protein